MLIYVWPLCHVFWKRHASVHQSPRNCRCTVKCCSHEISSQLLPIMKHVFPPMLAQDTRLLEVAVIMLIVLRCDLFITISKRGIWSGWHITFDRSKHQRLQPAWSAVCWCKIRSKCWWWTPSVLLKEVLKERGVAVEQWAILRLLQILQFSTPHVN